MYIRFDESINLYKPLRHTNEHTNIHTRTLFIYSAVSTKRAIQRTHTHLFAVVIVHYKMKRSEHAYSVRGGPYICYWYWCLGRLTRLVHFKLPLYVCCVSISVVCECVPSSLRITLLIFNLVRCIWLMQHKRTPHTTVRWTLLCGRLHLIANRAPAQHKSQFNCLCIKGSREGNVVLPHQARIYCNCGFVSLFLCARANKNLKDYQC